MSSHEKLTALRLEIQKIRPEDFKSFEDLLRHLNTLSREGLISEFQKIVKTPESFDTALQILYFFDRFLGDHSNSKAFKEASETLKEILSQEANNNIERTEESEEFYEIYNPDGRISVGGFIPEPFDFMHYAMDFVCNYIIGPELEFHEVTFSEFSHPDTPVSSQSIDSQGAEEAKSTPPAPSVTLPFFDTSSPAETSRAAQEKVAGAGAGNSAVAEPHLPPSELLRDQGLFRKPLDIPRPPREKVMESAAKILQKDPPTGHPEA